MSDVAFVEEAAGWAKVLTHSEARGPGDMENAWRRLEKRYGVPRRTFWALRYRKPAWITAFNYQLIRSAYEAECERQLRLYQHELEITKAKSGSDPALVGAAVALVSEATEQDQLEGKTLMPVTLLDRQDAVKSAAQAKRERDTRLGKVHRTNNVVRLFQTEPAPVIQLIQQEAPEPVEVPVEQDLGPRRGSLSSHAIVLMVAKYYGVSVTDIYAGGRKPFIIRPRHVAVYLTKQADNKTFYEVAADFGRDHTTILNACNRIEALRHSDTTLEQHLQELTSKIAEAANAVR